MIAQTMTCERPATSTAPATFDTPAAAPRPMFSEAGECDHRYCTRHYVCGEKRMTRDRNVKRTRGAKLLAAGLSNAREAVDALRQLAREHAPAADCDCAFCGWLVATLGRDRTAWWEDVSALAVVADRLSGLVGQYIPESISGVA